MKKIVINGIPYLIDVEKALQSGCMKQLTEADFPKVGPVWFTGEKYNETPFHFRDETGCVSLS